MKLNYRVIGNILGALLMLNAGFMYLCIPFSLYYEEGDFVPLTFSATITFLFGISLWLLTREASKELSKREGYLIVSFGWIIMSVFGSLPYLFSNAIPDFTNAFFETISGFSTTGASVLEDIEAVPKGILFWRSLTQWIGGMGIIVLAVAILPILGIGGMQLFVAEAPGITPDKLQPRIKETAKRLWYVYVALTVTEMVMLWVAGMSFFDACNHALTTMATGGFSTKNASIAHFEAPIIHYILAFFMFMAGTNFTLTYFSIHFKFKPLFRNEEFRAYLLITIISTVVIAIFIYNFSNAAIESSIRKGLFTVVSIVTTTGYVIADYTSWTPTISVIIFVLMFVGASAGSTAGGVKVVRHVLLFKNSLMEFKRQLHPNAVIPVRFNNKAVSQDIIFNILAFIMIYILIFALGSILIALMGNGFMTSIGAVATCLGNIGPGFGTVGPVNNFAHIQPVSKWILSFLMLMGRLELFTFLMILTPFFWRKY